MMESKERNRTTLGLLQKKGNVQFSSAGAAPKAADIARDALLEARKFCPFQFDCCCTECGEFVSLDDNGRLCCQNASFLPIFEFQRNPALRSLFYSKHRYELPD